MNLLKIRMQKKSHFLQNKINQVILKMKIHTIINEIVLFINIL